MKIYPSAGDTFDTVSKRAKDLAKSKHLTISFDFNGIQCLVSDRTVLDWLWRDCKNAHIMEWETVGPECAMQYDANTEIILYSRKLENAKKRKENEDILALKDAAQKEYVDYLTRGINISIIPVKLEEYNEFKKINSEDGYGQCVVDYVEYWAKLMQLEIANGKALNEIAETTQSHLSFLGITGFMYGCAVQSLAQFWIYGEELRKWHNKQYNVDPESKGVVNPAIITINV